MAQLINFFLATWLLMISAVGGAAGYYLYVNWNTLSPQKKLLGVLIVVLVLHVIEEWVYPAGFHYIYNFMKGSHDLTSYPMNRLSDSLTNFLAVAISVLALIKWSDRPETALTVAMFSMLEVCVHLYFTATAYRELGTHGMTIPYTPGVVTAVLGWLPLAVANAVFLTRKRMLTPKVIAVSIGAIVALLVVLIVIPEGTLRSVDTPYGFKSQGYFDSYIDAGSSLRVTTQPR